MNLGGCSPCKCKRAVLRRCGCDEYLCHAAGGYHASSFLQAQQVMQNTWQSVEVAMKFLVGKRPAFYASVKSTSENH